MFQAACVAVLHTGWHVGYGDAVAYGVILQAVEVTTAIVMGMPALLKEGMSWREVRLRAMHTTPVKLPARPSSTRGWGRGRGRPRRCAALVRSTGARPLSPACRQASAIAGSPSPAPSSTASGSASVSSSRRMGSLSVPAISSSLAWRSVLGRKPDFIPKYTAWG